MIHCMLIKKIDIKNWNANLNVSGSVFLCHFNFMFKTNCFFPHYLISCKGRVSVTFCSFYTPKATLVERCRFPVFEWFAGSIPGRSEFFWLQIPSWKRLVFSPLLSSLYLLFGENKIFTVTLPSLESSFLFLFLYSHWNMILF